MTETPPLKGAKRATKRRIFTILVVALLSCTYVFWKESPVIILHNSAIIPLNYTLNLNDKEYAKGQLAANTQYTINLPFLQGRKARINIRFNTPDNVLNFMTKTGLIGETNLYIDSNLRISMEQTPPGFIAQEEEIK